MKKEEFYTARELARKLRVNIMTIYRYIKAGKLKAYKIGKEFRIDKEEFNRFLDKRKTFKSLDKILEKRIKVAGKKQKLKIKPFYKDKKAVIYNNDILNLLKTIDSNIIDLTITSPPYNVGHDYDNYNDNLSKEKYLKWMKNVAEEIFRVCKIGGRICINVPFAVKNKKTKKVSFLATKIAEIFNKVGFLDFEMITWHKGKNIKHFQGNNTAWGSWRSPSSPSFRPLGEVILVFSKIDRRLDGNKELSDLSSDDFKEWTKNIWYIDENKMYENILPIPNYKKFEHPAMFPVELVKRLIKLYSYTDNTILDPFNGTGTTTLSAFELGRKSIGVDISKKYCFIAKKRIINAPGNKPIDFSRLVNQDDSTNSINEVFPYKESFSPNLLKTLCEEFNITKIDNILDPFVGTGSAFNGKEIEKIYGYDTNPLAVDISISKLKKINLKPRQDIEIIKKILSDSKKLVKPVKLPEWKQFQKYVEKNSYNYVFNFIKEIEKTFHKNKFEFFKMVIISNLEKIFNYKKDGNGIKFRKSKIRISEFEKYYINLLNRAIILKCESQKSLNHLDIKIYNHSCLELKEISNNSIDIILTSPPYVNMFDYFETYKMELWTGNYINNLNELKNLRKKAVRSNLNTNITREKLNIKEINDFVKRIKNNRTRNMIHNYFFDMNKLIQNAYEKLKSGGWMFIVVGNSFYEAKPIPTDNLLAIIAHHNKFNVEEIKRARSLKTSPQQMKIINKNDQKYLRESIICLKK